jgi:electron transfer flavoprotein beta subunit
MAKIIACYKWVADEADLRINPDLSVDLSKAKGKISEYDKNAIEAAVQAAKGTGDTAVTLTFGSGKAKQSIKDALSRGPAEGFWVNSTSAEQADGAATSKVLAAAIEAMGDYGLILCAEGASDTFARQVGPRIAARLDIPCVSSATGFAVDGGVVTISRRLEDCIEVIATDLPAVVCVLPEINKPPIPGLKAVLDAGKKPVREFRLEDLGLSEADLAPKTELKDFSAYVMNRKNVIMDADSAAAKVKELVANLKREGVV